MFGATRSKKYYDSLEKEQANCPLCSSSESYRICDNDRYKMGVVTVGCSVCGLIYTNPRPTEYALSSFYCSEYRRYYQSVDKPSVEYIKKFRKDVRAAYTVSVLMEICALGEGPLRVLDFGCGEGSLLKEIGSRFPQIERTGVEPGQAFRMFASEYAACDVFPDLDSLRDSKSSEFDLIILNHVFEHLSNPRKFLQEIAALVASSGLIYIDVPNVSRYSSVESLHIAHLVHFSKGTLKDMMRSAGWKPVECREHFPPNHPASVFCAAKVYPNANQLIEWDAADKERINWKRVEKISNQAWIYHMRRSLPYRALTYIPRRIKRVLS